MLFGVSALIAHPHDREKLLTFRTNSACIAGLHHVSAPKACHRSMHGQLVSIAAYSIGLRALESNEILMKGGAGRKPVHRDDDDLIERS